MPEKITKIYPQQGAASKMFHNTSANSSFSPVDFSKIGKFTSLGNIFYSKYMRFCKYTNSFRDLSKYKISDKLAWLEIELALVSRNIFDAAPSRE